MTAVTAAEAATSRSLTELVQQRASGSDIARFLNALSPDERLQQVLAITGRRVKYLYDAAKGAEPLRLDEFVPEDESGTVIFEGRNSLPMFSRFQKRFARLGGDVIGYNHQPVAVVGSVIGPGYFVVRPPNGEGEHGDELYFDYTVAPPGFGGDTPPPGQPSGWPAYKPNEKGLSKPVYAHMIDYCRRVATGVLVGKAYKHGAEMGAYFTLTLPH